MVAPQNFEFFQRLENSEKNIMAITKQKLQSQFDWHTQKDRLALTCIAYIDLQHIGFQELLLTDHENRFTWKLISENLISMENNMFGMIESCNDELSNGSSVAIHSTTGTMY